MKIRREAQADAEGVHQLHLAAFETDEEATIVDRIRHEAAPIVSLVGVEGDRVVGHILFSPASVDGVFGTGLMVLGPMAVLPDRQRKGLGSRLVEAGLDECRGLGCSGVVLVGHPEFYPRFGFEPASRRGLVLGFSVPDEVFMVCESVPGSLREISGLVGFHAAFD